MIPLIVTVFIIVTKNDHLLLFPKEMKEINDLTNEFL